MVCGNIGDDNSTTCELCGNPYADVAEDVSDAAGTAVPGEQPAGQDAEAPAGTERQDAEASSVTERQRAESRPQRTGRPVQTPSGTRPVHRMRTSGPQIYGQSFAEASGSGYGQQGMVRRSVQGRPVNQMPGAAGRPANAMAGQGGRPADTMAGRPVDTMAGRPANGAPGQMNRPINPVPNMGPRPGMVSGGYQPGRIMETARKMLGSPLFLLIAVLHTVYLAGAIAAIFLNQMNYSQAVRLIRVIDLPAQVSGYTNTIISLLSTLDSGAIVANLVLHIPDLLFCIGLWMIFFSARTAKENMFGGGFGFVRATVIINMVVACLTMLAMLIVSVAVVIAAWVSGTTSVIVISAIILVAVIVATMLVIMYHFCYLATWKTCRLNGDEGEEYGSVYGFVAAVHILIALLSVINLLSGIVNSEIANIIGAVGNMGWMILFAVWIFLYRGRMEDLEP